MLSLLAQNYFEHIVIIFFYCRHFNIYSVFSHIGDSIFSNFSFIFPAASIPALSLSKHNITDDISEKPRKYLKRALSLIPPKESL